MLEMVRDARQNGLTTPVLFMGYYNPILRYGESRFLPECKAAGVNGFIVVDLPLKEAMRFREGCTRNRYGKEGLTKLVWESSTLTDNLQLTASPMSR